MSGSKRNQEDPITSTKASDTDNPFIAFRRALDAQVSSFFRSVFSPSGVNGRTWPDNENDLSDFDNAFNEFRKRWDNFIEDTKRDASKFYSPEEPFSDINEKSKPFREMIQQSTTEREMAEASQQDPETKNVASVGNSSWVGYDGKKRMESQQRLPSNRLEWEHPNRSTHRRWPKHSDRTWGTTFSMLKPRFFETSSEEQGSMLHNFQYPAFPGCEALGDGLDDPFAIEPAAVPFLLNSPYSPINISSTNFYGERPSPHEEAKLTSPRFKDAFEDLTRLHNNRRMVQPSETYASQRNFSGHPMHWITRLIEAGVLGNSWSVWGNGATRHGLWFFNSLSRISINATQHSRLTQMPHIPYQGYVMQNDWFAPNCSAKRLPEQLKAAVHACNLVSSFAASSEAMKRGQDRRRYYVVELNTLQSANANLLSAKRDLYKVIDEETEPILALIQEKIVDIGDRCVNLSEYLLSKSLHLEKAWWYRPDHDALFESGEHFANCFTSLPFLAHAFDGFHFSSAQIEQWQNHTKLSGDVDMASRAAEEIFVDLHRSKKLVETALLPFDGESPSFSGISEELPAQSLGLYRAIIDNLQILKSHFVAEGRWSDLSEAWVPGSQSDYWFEDVDAIRSDCFPSDPDASIHIDIPMPLQSLYTDPTSFYHDIVRSPEIPSRQSGMEQFYQYLSRLFYYNDPLTAARSTLLRENIHDNSLRHGLGNDFFEYDALNPEPSQAFPLGATPGNGDGNPELQEGEGYGYGERASEEQKVRHFNEKQCQAVYTPSWWPSEDEYRNTEAIPERSMTLSTTPSQRPGLSQPTFDRQQSSWSDHEPNPVVSTSSTVTVQTLPDGSVERKSVVKTIYADGKEETNETVNVERAADQSAPPMARRRAPPGDKEDSGFQEKSNRKWFWK